MVAVHRTSREQMPRIIDDDKDRRESVPIRYDITSYGADYPVDSLVDRLNSGAIYVPQFQRNYVWNIKQASRFIESLLLGLPVPGIFLAREPDTQKLVVIDGQQRLQTIRDFYRGIFGDSKKEFALNLNSPGEENALHGLTYQTLPEDYKRQLADSIIHATIIRQEKPSDGQSSVYSIFERLNTGGTKLEPQEIRASIYHGEFSRLLGQLNENQAWRSLFGPKSARMRDQELILRFFALFYDRVAYRRPMKEFLNQYMDRNRDLELQSEEELRIAFVPSVEMIEAYIGKNAFKPERALNAAVYDAIMVGVATRNARGPIREPESLKVAHSALLADAKFIEAISSATSDEQNVATRIDLAVKQFAKVR